MPKSKRDAGATAAIIVLSIVVLLFVIGFVIIGTTKGYGPSPREPVREFNRRYETRPVSVNTIRKPAVVVRPQQETPAQTQNEPLLGGAGVSSSPAAAGPSGAASTATYQDNTTMEPPIMGVMHRAANTAFNLDQRSMQHATTYRPAGSAGPRVGGSVPPGGGDEERRQDKIPAAALNLDNAGYIPQVIAHAEGPAMAHSMPTSVLAAAFGANIPEDGALASVDPESAAQLDKALALSGVPASFGLDADAYERRKAAEIIRTMELTGAADPSIEQVLAASTPFIATQSLLKRAADATGAIDRSIIIEAPLRFLYNNPGYRLATPGVTLSPVVAEGGPITPGQEYYMLQTGCFDGTCAASAKTEPF